MRRGKREMGGVGRRREKGGEEGGEEEGGEE